MLTDAEISYYNGDDLKSTIRRPTRPTILPNATAAVARAYADAMETYEEVKGAYDKELEDIRNERHRRQQELKEILATRYRITVKQVEILWKYIEDSYDNDELSYKISEFSDLVELATKFSTLGNKK
jgi:predicted nuclease with TOPRIM domain